MTTVEILRETRTNKAFVKTVRKSGTYCLSSSNSKCRRCCLFCKRICKSPNCWHQDFIRDCEGRITEVEAFYRRILGIE